MDCRSCGWVNGYTRCQDGSAEFALHDHRQQCSKIKCHRCYDYPGDIIIVPGSRENGWRATFGPCPECTP